MAGIDQRQLAERAGLSVPTIQRMEASDGVIRGNVDSLIKIIAAMDEIGIELIGEGNASPCGGRGVRLRADTRVRVGEANERPPHAAGSRQASRSG